MFPVDQNKQQLYQRYAQAAQSGNYAAIDPNEAAGNLQQFAQNAPPSLQQQAYIEAFSQMTPDQLRQFVQQLPPDVQSRLNATDPQALGQGFAQVTQQRPGLLQEAGSVLNHPVAKVVVAGLAAVAAKHIWDQHQQAQVGAR